MVSKKAKAKQPAPLPEDLDAFISRLSSDSDRGAALVAAALLDAQLEQMFLTRLKHNQNTLLNYPGPLASFASRIRLARALEWIDEDVEVDLNVIRDIRNVLAHSFDRDLGFSDPKIVAACGKLRVMNSLLSGFDSATDRLHQSFSLDIIEGWRRMFDDSRRRYLTGAHFIAQHLKQSTNEGNVDQSLASEVEALGRNFRIEIRGSGTSSPRAPDARADA